MSAEDLARTLKHAALKSHTIAIAGNNSKRMMAGPVLSSNVVIATTGLRRVLQYERNDLTISVESGLPFAELQALLARNGQMIALDPPFFTQATVGGVVASNSSGSLRRGFGTARDLVIGMTFATLEGKLVKTGGMVVKNVAGLDTGKLMIGSFGTLAAVASVNFRVHSLPPETRTFLFSFADLKAAIAQRDAVVRSILQPMAIDLISPAAAVRFELRGYVLAIRAGGSKAILARYACDLQGSEQLSGAGETRFWEQIREFTPEFLGRQPGGVVIRISTTMSDVAPLQELISGPSISRAASGVTYAYLTNWQASLPLWTALAERNWTVVVEFAPPEIRGSNNLWLERSSPRAEDTFAIMSKVKQMFDPSTLLNRSRLYGKL
jgi:glycolate oxidase FAD binding subunit